MPKVLHRRYQKDCKIRKKLKEIFEQFHRLNADSSHYASKFLEVYEKDKMCGCHIFPLKAVWDISLLYIALICTQAMPHFNAFKVIICMINSLKQPNQV